MMNKPSEANTDSYYDFIKLFQFNVESLKMYTETVAPVIKRTLNKKVSSEVKKVSDVITATGFFMSKENELMDEKMNKSLLKARKLLHNQYGVIINKDSVAGIGEKGVRTINQLNDYRKFRHLGIILRESSIINLVIFFEILVGQIIKNRLIKYPKSNEDIEKKSLKLEDIRKLGTLENAQTYLIEEEVSLILRKSYADWIEYIKNRYNLKLDFLKDHNNEIVEIFQRRNLLVHNYGIINNIYLTNVDSSLTEGLLLGEYLPISDEYLRKSFDLIEQTGVLLCLEVWSSMEKRSQDRIDYVLETAYDLMKKGNWKLAKTMYLSNLKEKEIQSDDKTASQLNYWLCVKKISGFKAIEDEVKKADFSDKNVRYRLGLAALLEDRELFYNFLLSAVNTKEITYQNLTEWPILEFARKDDKFAEILSTMNGEVVTALREIKVSVDEVATTSNNL